MKNLERYRAAFHVLSAIGDGRMLCVSQRNREVQYIMSSHHLGLTDHVRVALWPSIPVLILLVWLLVTYAIFPANVTDRHYLTVSPVIGFIFITVYTPAPPFGNSGETNPALRSHLSSPRRANLKNVIIKSLQMTWGMTQGVLQWESHYSSGHG